MVGTSTAALSIIPITTAAWLLGVRGSLVSGAFVGLLNLLLFRRTGDPVGNSILPNLLGSVSFLGIGMAVGWTRGLLDRVKRQAEELRGERQALQEEVRRRIEAEERSTHDALHDPLTGLPNRRLFADRLAQAMEWNRRRPHDLFALVYLDLDRFKVVNDSLGHSAGDKLLVGVGQRLRSSVRTMDTVARMGGDEFALLLGAVGSDNEVMVIARRIQSNLETPFELLGNSLVVTASVGIVLSLHRYERQEDILRDADIAMYAAKVSGKNQYRVFDTQMREQAEGVLRLEGGLRDAIRNGELRLHYQPILSLKTLLINGFEALVRWEHPERGLLYPADFLRTAEESGLIVPLGHWVLREACRQMKQWHVHFNLDPPLIINVNLSSRQFAQPDLVRQIEAVLRETSFPATRLVLELTEFTLIEDLTAGAERIERLRALGVGIEIDDFGTGYSSLGYLRHLQVNSLKIDRSFTSTLGTSQSAVPIIRAIVAMAGSLGMKVTAEGIETADQVNSLIELDCDYGQGYFLNTPRDSHSTEQLIRETLAKPG
jgi:diguanylate cyclase (GGDEF)-like protein